MQFANRVLISSLALVSAVLFLAIGAAAAPNLTGVSVAPSPATAPASIVVTLQRSGNKKCAVLVIYDGTGSTQHKVMQNNQLSFNPVLYPNPGTYTVTAKGKKKNAVAACGGNPMTASFQVNASGGSTRPRAEKAADRPRTFKKKLPKATRAADTPRALRYKPTIESALFIAADGNQYSAGFGQLAPRGRLILKGKGFDDKPGAIRLQGLPKGEAFLEVVKWSDTKVEGTLPSGLGGTLEKAYPVNARVLRWAENEWSNPYSLQYQLPFEVKTLSLDDSAVKVTKCGDDANTNVCNRVEIGSGCRNIAPMFVPPPTPTPTLYATHKNCSGAVGDDSGQDRFEINLKNGWIVREILDFERKATSSDEWIEHLVLTRGQKNFSVGWRATPGDRVTYWYKINIVGPMGTSHK